jgi:hypothetical protein
MELVAVPEKFAVILTYPDRVTDHNTPEPISKLAENVFDLFDFIASLLYNPPALFETSVITSQYR